MSKIRKKVFIIEIVLITLALFASVTYSLYVSEAEVATEDIPVADFIFNSNKTNSIEIPFENLIPGSDTPYTFEVTNNFNGFKTEVNMEYQITIRTLGVLPLRFTLTKLGSVEDEVMTCTETSTRNLDGVIECKTPVLDMEFKDLVTEEFRLNVIFSSIYNDSKYSSLVDYIDIEIDSWQKIE